MSLHLFIFDSGIWLGKGTISLINSTSYIDFFTKWEITEKKEGVYEAIQIVEIMEEEHLINRYLFNEISPQIFHLTLENELIGKINGTGFYNEQVIKWEFKERESLDGHELYELQKSGEYRFNAEFGSEANYGTVIKGTIWKKLLS